MNADMNQQDALLSIEVTDPDLIEAPIPFALKQEITVFRKLQPLLSACFGLNHDLNNPLAGILGFAEILLEPDSGLNEESRAHVRIISDCAERMKLSLIRLSDRKIELAGEIDLREISALLKSYAQTDQSS